MMLKWNTVFSSIFYGSGRKWGMLWVEGLFVLRLSEGFSNIARHGEVNFVVLVVPVGSHANVLVACPVCAEAIIRFKNRF